MLEESHPLGYEWLVRRFEVSAFPRPVRSYLLQRGVRRTETEGGFRVEFFPKKYDPGDIVSNHLEFALKYEGLNLEVLAAVFEKLDTSELNALTEALSEKPTGRHVRRIWFLYEWLTDRRLPLPDLASGDYVDLLDPEDAYCGEPRTSRRHRVRDNLLGTREWCPIMRRTKKLEEFEERGLDLQCRAVEKSATPETLARAVSYLHYRETKSSFEIERERPDAGRTARFVRLLEEAGKKDFLDKESLVALQQAIVDSRFAETDWRTNQNYVGESHWGGERVQFIPPKPEDLPGMMEGLLAAHRRMEHGGVHPVVAAAVVAFGFVFLHPFADGNGRIHRFLIHNVLARRQFTPPGLVLPVSAVMLRKMAEYHRTLERFSRPLMALVEYDLDSKGALTARGDTAPRYRYPDLTGVAEDLFEFLREAIEVDLVQELAYLPRNDAARRSMREVVDLPGRLQATFLQVCLQNGGRLSKRKREDLFGMLTDDEVARLEACVREAFELEDPAPDVADPAS